MIYNFILSLLFFSSTCQAADNLQPVFNHPQADMLYPHVAGDYLVYSQRVGNKTQIMRLKKDELYGAAKDVSSATKTEILRDGIALNHGDMAYVSNRLGGFTPWLSHHHQQTNLAVGAFHSLLMPNHLNASANGQVWAFDSTLESARKSRIASQLLKVDADHELLGQAWRLYHSKYWIHKSGYPATQAGETNKFQQPHLFTFTRKINEINMLGDGFDASLSADGKSMVFVRENDGNFDLWQQHTDGSGLKRLTKNTFADVEPALSADGSMVAFVSNRDAAGEVLQTSIYILNIATQKVQRITFGDYGIVDGGPAWLDRKTLIFHSNRNPQSPDTDTVDNWQLWSVSLP